MHQIESLKFSCIGPGQLNSASVVNQHIDTAKLAYTSGNGVCNLLLRPNVNRQRQGLPASVFNLFRRSVDGAW